MTDRQSAPYDLAIVGGGCAGLSLAAKLAETPRLDLRIVVIDSREHYTNDRTWCFWSDNPGEYVDLIQNFWSAWTFSSAKGREVHHSGDWRYVKIPSSRFYQSALTAIQSSPHLELRLGRAVHQMHTDGDSVTMDLGGEAVTARHVVDTRPPRSLSGATLLQSFVGQEIKTELACFDVTQAGLMEDMRVDDHGFAFTYVLPTSPTTALIEATRFTPSPPPEAVLYADLDRAIRSRCQSHVVQREEVGVLPMGLLTACSPLDSRVVRAGTAGGAIRAASGYGFQRIQSWARLCASSVLKHGRAIPHPVEPPLRRQMDSLFLRVIREQPDLAPDLFLRLAKALRPDAFARFMSDRATPLDWITTVSALPKTPFLSALVGKSSTSTGARSGPREMPPWA